MSYSFVNSFKMYVKYPSFFPHMVLSVLFSIEQKPLWEIYLNYTGTNETKCLGDADRDSHDRYRHGLMEITGKGKQNIGDLGGGGVARD